VGGIASAAAAPGRLDGGLRLVDSHDLGSRDHGGVGSRDFIYVQDIVDGLILCAVRGEPGGVYNLASGAETSILELASLVNELTGNPTPADVSPAREWDRSGRRFGSTEKARRELGFEAGVALREGLERTIAWMRENMELIDACVERHAQRMQEAVTA